MGSTDQSPEETQNSLHHLEAQYKALQHEHRQLRQEQQGLRTALARCTDRWDGAPVGLLTLDSERRILEASHMSVRMMGHAKGELIGQTLDHFIPPEDRESWRSSLEAHSGNQVPKTCQVRLERANGSRWWATLDCAAIVDDQGDVQEYRVAVNDVTVRVRAGLERERMLAQAVEDRRSTQELAGILDREWDILQTIMESTHAHLAFLDADFNFVRVNNAYAQGAGYSEEALIGRNHFELFPDAENQRIFERARETGTPVSFHARPFEYPNRPELGTTYWDWTLVPVQDQSGRVRGLVFSLLDVTERARLEKALREARDDLERRVRERTAELRQVNRALEVEIEDRKRIEKALRNSRTTLESLFESTPNGVLLVDQQGRIVRVNRQTELMFGYSREELFGQVVELLLPEALKNAHAQERLAYFKQPRVRPMGTSLKITGRRKGGELFPADVMLGPVHLDDRTLHIAVVRDVTQRARTQAALQESEARFRTFFEEAPFGLALVEPDGRLLASNPALQKMLGYGEEALQRRTLGQVGHRDEVSGILGALKGEERHHTGEYRLAHKDGGTVWVRVTASAVRVGGAPFAIMTAENITERKRMERELAELRHRLAESREAERLHLAQELHDGPIQDLYGVRYQLGTLAKGLVEEADLSQWAAAQAGLQRATQALRATCQALRPPALAHFGLEAAIRSHAESFQETYPDLQVELELTPDEQRLPEHMRLALFRIYQQALSNVARHADAQRVMVRFHLDEEQVQLEIRDDGRGFQMPGSWIYLAREGHLGLAGAAERAEGIGGELQVTSTPGDGTVLRVQVPRPHPVG
jgi:PAS domain S-box-containing protein